MRRKKALVLAAAMLLPLLSLPVSAWKMANARLTTPWASDVSPEKVHPEYPRPQMVRSAWKSLNGLWEWQSLQEMDSPLSDNWREILVPFAPEAPLSGIGSHAESMAYRRTFQMPDEWKGKRVMLNFEAVDWKCEAFVNGTSVGTHEGGYDPFSFDITEALSGNGDEELLLRVYDPTDKDAVPRGKQVLNPGGIFYTCTSGIWQTVWMEAVEKSYIESFRIIPSVDNSSVVVSMRAGGEKVDNAQFTVRVLRNGEVEQEKTGSTSLSLTLKLNEPELWTPDHPFLYDMEIVYAGDAVQTYFGMRKINIAKDSQGYYRTMLNNEFLFQMGPLDQGFWPDGIYTAPTDEALKSDIVTMKKMGFNMVRKHIKVEPRRWYYWCDKLGLMVWQDMPGENYGGMGGVADNGDYFTRELTAMVNTHFNTPSIVMWVIFNEGGGQTNKDYTKKFVDLVRKLDTTRLINEASGWNHYGYGDMKDIHPYPAPSYTTTSGKQAMACGEYGGVQYVLASHLWSSSHWGYSSVESAEEYDATYTDYANRLAQFKTRKGLSAAVYTQLTDVEVEVNGLMTYDRVIKSDINRIREANRLAIEKVGTPVEYLLSPADEEGETWKYTTSTPTDEWFVADFNDKGWREGKTGFGANGLSNMHYGTRWTSSDIWIRKNVELSLSDNDVENLKMRIYYDEDCEVYFNGVLAFSATGYITDYKNVEIKSEALAALNKQGQNVIAAHCHQTAGGQFLDIALYVEKPVETYTPTRMLRTKMEYSHSSELAFMVGYSLDVNAEEPAYVQHSRRIPFANKEAGAAVGLDNSLLCEMQDLLFDLTPLLQSVDAQTPFKVFFSVDTPSDAVGSGMFLTPSYEDASSGTLLGMKREPSDLVDIHLIRNGEQVTWSCVYDPSKATPISSDTGQQSVSDFFDFSPSVILKGQKVYLENRSSENPSDLLWMVSGDHSNYLVSGTSEYASSSLSPDVAGVYSVSQVHLDNQFQVTSDKKLYVCNAASGTGLSLAQGASFSFPNPFTARSYQFVFDWWMNAEKKEAFAMQTEDTNEWLMKALADGSVSVTLGGKSASSAADFILADGWHHYAVAFYYGKISFYRDGSLFDSFSGAYNTSFSAWNSDVRVKGYGIVIDEFRCWKKNLKLELLHQVCVAPLENISEWEASDRGLWVYYSFDEPAGNAQDQTSEAHDGVVSDNAKRVPSDGVFSLDFENAQGSVEYVTADYLTNPKAPFLHTSEAANDFDASRFYVLEHGTAQSSWQGNFLSKEGNGVYVDAKKRYGLAAASGWYGIPAEWTSCHLTQSPLLPAGLYALKASTLTEDNTWQCRLVAGGYSVPLSDGVLVFAVPEEQEVSLGVELRLPAFSEVVFREFNLLRYPCKTFEANGETLTSVEQVAAEKEELQVFDISGRRIVSAGNEKEKASSLSPGFYIVKEGAHTTKRWVR